MPSFFPSLNQPLRDHSQGQEISVCICHFIASKGRGSGPGFHEMHSALHSNMCTSHRAGTIAHAEEKEETFPVGQQFNLPSLPTDPRKRQQPLTNHPLPPSAWVWMQPSGSNAGRAAALQWSRIHGRGSVRVSFSGSRLLITPIAQKCEWQTPSFTPTLGSVVLAGYAEQGQTFYYLASTNWLLVRHWESGAEVFRHLISSQWLESSKQTNRNNIST